MLVHVLAATDPNPPPALWRALTEVAFFIGLFGTLGVTLVYGAVIRPVLNRPSVDPGDRTVLTRAANTFMACIGVFALFAFYLQIAGKAARVKGKEIPFSHALAPSAIWHYVSAPGKKGEWISSGAEALVQYSLWAVAAILLILLFLPRARTALLVWSSFIVAVIGVQVLSVPTDFGKYSFDGFLDDNLTHVHIISNATWTGGIVTLVVLAARSRQLTSSAGLTWAQLWTRFSKVALTTVGCTLITGSWLAWRFVGSPRELFTTEFGHVLLIKISLVVTMIAIGGVNEFLMMPRIARARTAGDDRSVFRLALKVFPRLVAVEGLLAVGVLVAITFLTGSSRDEGGDPTPVVNGGVLAIGAVMAVLLAASLIATAKVSDRLARASSAAPSPAVKASSVA
ncbi:CopD family protein [Actinoplanes sp. NPDC051411]|uniref:copper resistance D family protein n=1 Tax=Actinoplanes sp. NPDC051411 TaxID=3155522 RepID=UPI003412B648